MKPLRWAPLALFPVLLLLVALPTPTPAEDPFTKKVGDLKVGDVAPGPVLEVPYLLWGGDVVTFLANGGVQETKKDTLFGQQGLKLKLTDGNDFVAQVKNYMAGKTPFLRGTMSQLAQASEVLGKDKKTQPVVFLQLTWSAGDHMVARSTVQTTNDLKGKKVALQAYGPHVGMLDDVLRTAGLTWKDITVVWTPDVTGKDGPVELFRQDATIDACFAMTPDMESLTSGLDKIGPGTDKTVKGARVLVSTKTLSHSIADVYACRKDYYDKNKETIEKFIAGYLKACEELVEMKLNHDKKDRDKALEEKYKVVLKMTQDIYGKEAIHDAGDAHGLIMDANFVALPGNYEFFKAKADKNPVNFANRLKRAMDMAVGQGHVQVRSEPLAADLDYDRLKDLGKLKLPVVEQPPAGNKWEGRTPSDVIFSFTIFFDSDEPVTDWKKYDKQFQELVDDAALFGNAFFQVRGHVDPRLTLNLFVKAGLDQQLITREKVNGQWKYKDKDGKDFDLSDTKKVVAMIKAYDFGAAEDNPQPNLKLAEELSDQRAKEVRNALIDYAKRKNLTLSVGQFHPVAVGISEPKIAVPTTLEQAAMNRRVEFRVLKFSAEKLMVKDFND